jgi:uncharacterized LabA/DUF88 family protein
MILANSTTANFSKYSTHIAITIAAIATISSNFSSQVLVSIASMGFIAYSERERKIAAQFSNQQSYNHLLAAENQLQTATTQIATLEENAGLQQQRLQYQENKQQQLQQQILNLNQQRLQLLSQVQSLARISERLAIVNEFNRQPQKPVKNLQTPTERGRISIFIDGANLERTTREQGHGKISLQKLRDYIRNGNTSGTDYYYLPVNFGQQQEAIDPEKTGFQVITKTIYRDKANQDTELVLNMLTLALIDTFDTAVLIAGDRDYIPIVRVLRKLGCQVELLFWQTTTEGYPQTPKDLIAAVGQNRYTPLEEIKEKITFPCAGAVK